ncbi:MAG: lytic transglycosylase domain-containing protein [Herminiimonas sp.]|nr:lytic transglycosylase domain-containing protein [Herminiimonas sp.]
MIHRLIRASRDLARSTTGTSSALVVFAKDTASGFVTTVHHTFMILGVSAIAALAVMFVRPDITDHLKALSPFTLANAQEPLLSSSAIAGLLPASQPLSQSPPAPLAATLPAQNIASLGVKQNIPAATQHQQILVKNWLAKKYRVASDATDMLVSAAYVTAKDIKLDPLLILSVMAIESGFNPFAESPVGAQGLMQVMSKVHHEKFEELGGVKAALNPVANIKVGSLILKDYVTRGGSVEAGLKLYVGAAAFDTDFGYGSKVLAEYRRLKDVAVGKNVPVTAPAYAVKAKPAERVAPAVPATPAATETPTTTQINTVSDASGKVAAL